MTLRKAIRGHPESTRSCRTRVLTGSPPGGVTDAAELDTVIETATVDNVDSDAWEVTAQSNDGFSTTGEENPDITFKKGT